MSWDVTKPFISHRYVWEPAKRSLVYDNVWKKPNHFLVHGDIYNQLVPDDKLGDVLTLYHLSVFVNDPDASVKRTAYVFIDNIDAVLEKRSSLSLIKMASDDILPNVDWKDILEKALEKDIHLIINAKNCSKSNEWIPKHFLYVLEMSSTINQNEKMLLRSIKPHTYRQPGALKMMMIGRNIVMSTPSMAMHNINIIMDTDESTLYEWFDKPFVEQAEATYNAVDDYFIDNPKLAKTIRLPLSKWIRLQANMLMTTLSIMR